MIFGFRFIHLSIVTHTFCCLAEMASSSSQQRSGVTTSVPKFLVDYNEVEMKPHNHLPLLNIPNDRSYFMEARNFLLSGPAKTVLTLNILAVQTLLYNLWTNALVVTGETVKGTKYEYVSGFLPSKTDHTKLEEFSFTLRDFKDVLQSPAKPADTKAYESLPTEAQLIEFLEEIDYEWDKKIGKKSHTVKRSRMTAEWSYIFAHFNQCLTAKVGSHDQASTVHVQMVYSAVKNRKIY